MSETRRLGRGLEALLGPISKEDAQAQGAFRELAVTAIEPNRYQPRREFAVAELQELADSIAASGLLQPVVVRSKAGGKFELIAGERRWRAVQRLGWKKIPAVVREVDDQSLLTLALIENLQRDDLSPIDGALGYDRLIREFQLSQIEIARLVGKDRTTIANSVRLLKLPAGVQQLVQQKRLSEGHARALLALTEDRAIQKMGAAAAEHGWSVRELEARVRGEAPRLRRRSGKSVERPLSADVRRVEEALRSRLQTEVRVTARRKGRGFITVTYYSNDDLARVLDLILGQPFTG